MKRINRCFLFFLPLAMLLATSCSTIKSTTGKAGTQLAYKVGSGQSFTMKSEGSSTIKTEQMGESITVEMNSANETAYRVSAGSSDGTMQYEMEFKARKQSAKSQMGNNETDYSTWIGKKVGFSLSPRGVLSDFRGFDQLPEIAGATGEKVTGELVQKGMSDHFFKLPDHPVKIGETWAIKDSAGIPYGGSTLKKVGTTTYSAVEKVNIDGSDCFKIDITAIEKLSGEFEQQGTQIELTREKTSTGVIYFALDKGMYISMESTSVGSSQIYVAAAGITIPQEIKSKLSLNVVFD